MPSASSTALSRPHIAEASTGAGSTGARRAIETKGVPSPSFSDCISAFFAAQTASSSSRVTTPSRTSFSPKSVAAEGWLLIRAYMSGWV